MQLRLMMDEKRPASELWSQVKKVVRLMVPESEVRRRFFADLQIVEEDVYIAANLGSNEIPGVFQSIVDGIALESGSFRDGCVALVPFHRMRHLSFRHVVLVGVVENKIPSMGRQDPLLLDEQRAAINRRIGTDCLPLKGERYSEQVYLFRQLLDCASESLVLSFPRFARLDGRSQTVSHFLVRMAEGLTGRLGEYSLSVAPGFLRIPADDFRPDNPEDAIHAGEWEMAHVLSASAAGDASVVRGLLGISGMVRDVMRRRAARIYNLLVLTSETPQDGRLTGKALKRYRASGDLFADEISPTRLEIYAKCPRQYLLGIILGMEPLIEPGESLRLSAMERGSLVHDVLREVFEQARAEGLFPINEGNRSKLIAAATEALKSRKGYMIASGKVRDDFFWEMECENLLNDFQDQLDDEVRKSEGYTPYAFEVRFGKAKHGKEAESPFSKDTPVVLELEGGRKIRLAGRIDRVDAHPHNGLRVIDYKTGKNAFLSKTKKLVGGEGLQLPVYRLATKMLFGELAAAGVSAFYYHNTRPAKFKWAGIGQKEWVNMETPFIEAVKTIVDGITDGRFFPNPFGKKLNNHCSYCPFVSYCGPGIAHIAARKHVDPALEPFVAMKGIA